MWLSIKLANMSPYDQPYIIYLCYPPSQRDSDEGHQFKMELKTCPADALAQLLSWAPAPPGASAILSTSEAVTDIFQH